MKKYLLTFQDGSTQEVEAISADAAARMAGGEYVEVTPLLSVSTFALDPIWILLLLGGLFLLTRRKA